MNTLSLPSFERKIEALRDVLKGYENPLRSFYEPQETDPADLSNIKKLTADILSGLSESTSDSKLQLHRCFLEFCICFLESSCPEEDRTFTGLKKLASLKLYSKEAKCTFDFMLQNVSRLEHDEREEALLRICRDRYALFRNIAESEYEREAFTTCVTDCIDSFLARNVLVMTAEEYDLSCIDVYMDAARERIVKERLRMKREKQHE